MEPELLQVRSWSVNKVTLRQWLTALRREQGASYD